MENVHNRKGILLVNDFDKAEKLITAPIFRAFSIFNENLTGVEQLY